MRPPLRSLVGAVAAVALGAAGTAVATAGPQGPAAVPVVSEDHWATQPGDGLTRTVVILRTAAAPATTTSASRLPSFLLPQLDVAKLQRAHAELGTTGHLVPGRVDDAAVTLYVAAGQARVVSTGDAWLAQVPAPDVAPPVPAAPATVVPPPDAAALAAGAIFHC